MVLFPGIRFEAFILDVSGLEGRVSPPSSKFEILSTCRLHILVGFLSKL